LDQVTQGPEWIAKGKTTLIQKDSTKGNAVDNYLPVACTPNPLTRIISENSYSHLER